MSETSRDGYALALLRKINSKHSNSDSGGDRSPGRSPKVTCLSFCDQTLFDVSRSHGALPNILWHLSVASNVSRAFGHIPFLLMKQKIAAKKPPICW
jgi:hypothetical protein